MSLSLGQVAAVPMVLEVSVGDREAEFKLEASIEESYPRLSEYWKKAISSSDDYAPFEK